MRTLFAACLLMPALLSGCRTPQSMVEAFTKGGPPVLESARSSLVHDPGPTVVTEFRFHSADGNAVALHREILTSDLQDPPPSLSDRTIDVDPDRQREGAVFSVRWSCGPGQRSLRMQAELIDSNHHHSNPAEYAIDCPG